jgi:hydroxybutyrate-dimer hydrolase
MRPILISLLLPALAGCASIPDAMNAPDFLISEIRITEHRGTDDLLSAGLGLEGLRRNEAPMPARPDAPTAAELRRRAIYVNWRGIADLGAGGGFGSVYGAVPTVPGREYQAFARVPGATQPHRVLAQVPDAFDRQARCLVVNAVSGSRGIYGAMAFPAAWALPRGCAMVTTDKGAGTGFFDFDTGTGVALDGTRAQRGVALEFDPGPAANLPAHRVAIKHAHSRDNPEADWGQHVLQAARFGLAALDRAFPALAPFTPENTRIIAAGLSNGGGAVLRAAEQDDEGLLDAVVAVAPNVAVAGARPLYDFASEAALLTPCALAALTSAPRLLPEATATALARTRCASLAAAGMLAPAAFEAQAAEALERLRSGGFRDETLAAGAVMQFADLWRSVMATYAQSLARTHVDAALCGYGFAALDAGGRPRASTAAERALWWSDGAGVAPTAGIGIVDGLAAGSDPALPGLLCARRLYIGSSADAEALRRGIEAIRLSARVRAPQTLIVHGEADNIIPIEFTTRPYVAAARTAGTRIAFWQVPNVQHFDAFLAMPPLAARYLPLLPYAYHALDASYTRLIGAGPELTDRRIATMPRGAELLSAAQLGL